AGRARVLVASDIAARGIDIDGITHVVNFELPHEPETYVHRIGRTGRAGNSGAAIAFCDSEEQPRWNKIQRLIAHPVDEVTDHPFHGSHLNEEPRPPQQPRQRNDQRRNANRSRQGARRGGGGGGGGSRSTSANGSRQRPR
ncbi:MAG: helicase-related protein, partial [Planctomycetota bacterium]